MKIKVVKGSEDLYPLEFRRKEFLVNSFKDICKKYDYQFVQTPVFESLELLCAKGGEEIKNQFFVLEKKGSEELGLRFDMTVPCARLFVQKQLELTKPTRWAYADENFRYERPQAGRARAFTQLGCEVYGSDSVLADAEQLNIIIDTFKIIGLTNHDFSIRVNDRNFLEGVLVDLVGATKVFEVISAFDKFNKIGEDNFFLLLTKDLSIDRDVADSLCSLVKIRGGKEKLLELDNYAKNEQAKKGLSTLKQISEFVDMHYVEFDMSIARGLDYYSGFVFEGFDKYGYFRALCGGGRYDNMIEQFGGQKTAAVGFAIGVVPITLLLEKLGKFPSFENKVDYFLTTVGEDLDIKKYALHITKKLRHDNKSCNLDISNRAMGKKFAYAESIGVENIIIVGENEVKDKTISMKNLKTGEQKIVKFDEL
ncbi:MAG: histidine--tRNA ligase [Candidatus Woesearchaeota archaeon]|jgi:histidyl-tRNA synthetase